MPAATDSATAPREMMMLFRKKRGKSGRVEEYCPRCSPTTKAA